MLTTIHMPINGHGEYCLRLQWPLKKSLSLSLVINCARPTNEPGSTGELRIDRNRPVQRGRSGAHPQSAPQFATAASPSRPNKPQRGSRPAEQAKRCKSPYLKEELSVETKIRNRQIAPLVNNLSAGWPPFEQKNKRSKSRNHLLPLLAGLFISFLSSAIPFLHINFYEFYNKFGLLNGERGHFVKLIRE